MIARIVSLLIALAACHAFGATAGGALPPCCQGAKAKSDAVKVTVVVILATEDGNFVDKKLIAIAEEVRTKNPTLKSFHLKSMASKSLAADEKVSFPMVDNKNALVVVKHGANKDNKVSLAVTAPDQGEIIYSTTCGKFLPIVTRYQTQKRERLILAIRVQPCNE